MQRMIRDKGCGMAVVPGGMTHAQIKGINRCRCGNSERYADAVLASNFTHACVCVCVCVCVHAQVLPNPLFASFCLHLA